MVKFNMVNSRNLIKLEVLLQTTYTYFLFSPKKCLKQCKLAELMETKNNKLFRNVNTRWISMFPTKRVLVEDKSLVVRMSLKLQD